MRGLDEMIRLAPFRFLILRKVGGNEDIRFHGSVEIVETLRPR